MNIISKITIPKVLKSYFSTEYYKYGALLYPAFVACILTLFLGSKSKIVADGLTQSHYLWGMFSSMLFILLFVIFFTASQLETKYKKLKEILESLSSIISWFLSQSLNLALTIVGMFSGHYLTYNLMYLGNHWEFYFGVILVMMNPIFLTALANGIHTDIVEYNKTCDPKDKDKKEIKNIILLCVTLTFLLIVFLVSTSEVALNVFLGTQLDF